ncbi:hybrid sensor histidine kinase/response regulator [Ideonella sp. BN130291]|uniref:hybrid sensor histidine kinase/response regulator n=1 Tax=Ideonella sp. BN130291 TaxID=3112940 RepID=UPI002E269549|nr:Hpt domain-containing protein [Ideonella sp. BN130291]
MDARDTETTDDLSALAWVQEELRKSLEAAHKSLRRFVKESEALSGSDVDAVDPGVLRTARQQLHQGVGALELVGLPAGAQLLRASEAAVQRLSQRPKKLNAAAVEAIERASFALLDYLARRLAGKPVSALALFPAYRGVQEMAGAERVHPADLWSHDWRWRDLPADAAATPRQPDADTRGELETQMLLMMRQSPKAAAKRMSDLFAGLAAGATERHLATLWQLASAFCEGQSLGMPPGDVYSKRIVSRLLAQLRICERGGNDVSERLAQDLLFFCAQAGDKADSNATPRMAAVRRVYGLTQKTAVNYEDARLGRFDPAWIAQARKRVAGAKDGWSAVAGGELHRLNGLAEQFALVTDSLKRLYPSGDRLADALHGAVHQTVTSGQAPSPELAMEVATAMLYLDASLEDGEFDHPEEAVRVQRLAQRIDHVGHGAPSEPLEGWMEELYRRVSDRQTMGSVVQELRASLSEAEKLIDQFFRNPAEREVLIPVPGQLSAMRGVLSVLGMEQASHAVVRMRDEVDGLIATEVDPQRAAQAGTFDRLAGNLGALGFLIDMLSVQPQLAKSLFTFDAESGSLRAVMGQGHRHSGFTPLDGADTAPAPLVGTVEPRLIEQARDLAMAAAHPEVSVEQVSRDLERLSHEALVADQSVLAETVSTAHAALEHAQDEEQRQAVREELAQVMADFVHTASDAATLAPEPVAAAPVPAPVPAPASAPTPAGATGLEEDTEMREIFLEEAREVMQNAREALAALADDNSNIGELTTVRRAFHTLKGSSRMVGLTDFGEAGWACEQLYNARLADAPNADDTLLGFTSDALAYLGDWIEAIAAGQARGHESSVVRHAADALRLEGRRDAMPLPGTAAPAALTAMVPELPAASELQLPAAVAAAPQEPAQPLPEIREPEIEVPATVETIDLSELPLSAEFLPEVQAEPAETTAVLGGAAAVPEVSFDLDLSSLDGTPAAAPEPLQTIELNLAPEEITEVQPAFTPVDQVDLALPDLVPAAEEAAAPEVLAEAPAAEAEVPAAETVDLDQVKIVGPLRISIPLFNIYLNEADELSRRLSTELAEWSLELDRPVGENAIAMAHSLAGNSATVGFTELSQLARTLEHALMRSQAIGSGEAAEAQLFIDAAEEIRRLLHQFAAGFLKDVPPELHQRLAAHEIESAQRMQALAAMPEADDSTDSEPVVSELDSAEADAAFPDLAANEPVAEPATAQPETAAAAEPADVAEQAPVAEAEIVAEPQIAAEPDVQAAVAEPAVVAEPIAPVAEPAPAMAVSAALEELRHTELKSLAALPQSDRRTVVARGDALDDEDDIDAVDAIDAELFPIFEEEGQELLPQLASRMREWVRRPADAGAAAACMRTLHTLKGGARLAGAMRLGEMAHRLETAIEHLLARGDAAGSDVEALEGRVDALQARFDALRSNDAAAYEQASAAVEEALREEPPALPVVAEALPEVPVVEPAPADLPPVADDAPAAAAPADPVAPRTGSLPAVIDWSRFSTEVRAPRLAKVDRSAASSHHANVRVRAPLLDRLVNHAGEVSITRSRIESDVSQLKSSLTDLTDNLERLRRQLRDIELQAETQITSRMEAAKAAAQAFDPLEFDRFTRFQELTRMMAESVNDVATVQRSLQRTLQSAEDELAAQARLTRDLQDDLLRTRMVEFEGLSERLYRVVRQAAKETGKQVRLDIVGGSIEVDRGVLDRMTGAFEHLLRNCVTHGIETPDVRTAHGKDAAGQITVVLTQEGNEVGVEFRDDGGGLNLERIRQRAVAMGLVAADAAPTEAELANLIFTPGFSTAETVTELAGRGIGMDVVRNEVNAMGGRIETATAAGQGTSFKLVLPLTTAVTQVVMVRCGDTTVAIPSTLIEIVRRAKPAEVEQAYASGQLTVGDRNLPFFWLGALLQSSPRGTETGRTLPVIIVRSAQQRVALHIDEVLGNQEVVVKNLGNQLSRLPGLAGMTLLASGAVALIYNPVALATLYGDAAWHAMREALAKPDSAAEALRAQEAAVVQAPLVLVVDDSLTVRRVTQRLLVREGYRVSLAKDGLEGLERLAEERPAVVLSDIEMPRMDGFDLVRNMRGDARWRELPVIMITSRIAQKHKDYAAELGVDHYLGKPYAEEDLLALVSRYASVEVTA